MTEEIVRDSKHRQLHVYSNLTIPNDKISETFNELFKPSYELEQYLGRLTNEIGGEYISATFRFQQLLGDFKEGSYPILVDTDKRKLVDRCIGILQRVYESNADKYWRILVTSDSSSFLREADRLPYVYVIKGDVVHMDFTDDKRTQTHIKAFADLLMISRAEKVYSVVVSQMYNSGFPRFAAAITGKPFHIITK